MKTLIQSLLFSFCFVGYSQMPSIRLNSNYKKDINNIRKTSEAKPTIDSLKIALAIIQSLTKNDIAAQAKIMGELGTLDFKDNIKNKTEKKPLTEKEYIIQSFEKILDSLKKEKEALLKPQSTTEDYEANKIKIEEITNKIKQVENQKKQELATIGKPARKFFPTINKEYRAKFFKEFYDSNINKTNYVNALYLTADNESATIQSELITDNLGPTRLVFGNVLTGNNDSEVDNSTQATQITTFKTFINGGGNFFLDFILPAYANYKEKKVFNFYTYLSLKGASYIKGFSGNIDTSTANGSFGLYNYLDFASENKRFSFFINGNISYTVGDKEFYKNLALSNEKPFLNGKIIAGINFINTFRLSAILASFGSDPGIRREKIMVGLQILPNYK